MATAETIIMAKRRADANIAITANVIASNIRVSANIAMTVNANKTASNIR